MTETEALELLKHHSYNYDAIEHPKTEKGFLGMLRPFDGQLYEANFHELMTIIKTLKQQLRDDKTDRELISSLWSICHYSKAWGLDKEGLLIRNILLSADQIKQLSTWVDCISYSIAGLLNSMDDEHAFELYEIYLENNKNDIL